MDMKVRPLNDRILVKRSEQETKSTGGILIPDSAAEKPVLGQVIAVGSGRRLDNGKIRPLDVKKGDTILFGKYNGTEVKVDGNEYLMMKEDDVLAVLDKN
jgi:chaperonin GroES